MKKMRLQHIILPADKQCYELYYRGFTALAAGGVLSFDTYYNSFSYSVYREYTSVKNVCFFCEFSGCAHIELCSFDEDERVLCSGDFSGSAELRVDISSLPEKGFLYPKITAQTDFTFMRGEYLCDCEPRGISCCIAICTYKRESYVLKNTELLRSFGFSFINRVFVIDNGNSLDSGALSDEFVSVLPNKNLGGSGGFTRGLIEARRGGFSHVVLMDDDVEFHPETLEQMTVFMSLLKDECKNNWFSAGMMTLDTPWVQHELGAYWNGKEAVINKQDADVRSRRNLLDNLEKSNLNYGGWWTLCMPVSVIDNGLPYPFFIKFDDVEYGLRRRTDCSIMTMNGIAVRHEAFDKKTSFVLDYYNLRNRLVVNATYFRRSSLSAVKAFLKAVIKQLVLYRYDNVPLIIQAADDFLSGVDFFLKTDAEQLNEELRRKALQLVPLEKLPRWNEDMRCDSHIKDTKITPLMWITAAGHFIPWFLQKKQISGVPLARASAKDCFGHRAVIQYQPGSENGIYAKRSVGKFARYLLLAFAETVKLLFQYKTVRNDYALRNAELTSQSFWESRLGL